MRLVVLFFIVLGLTINALLFTLLTLVLILLSVLKLGISVLLDELIGLIDLLSVNVVSHHDDFEADAAKLNGIAYLDLVAFVDEAACVVLTVLDNLPDLGGRSLSFFFKILDHSFVVYPIVAFKKIRYQKCYPLFEG